MRADRAVGAQTSSQITTCGNCCAVIVCITVGSAYVPELVPTRTLVRGPLAAYADGFRQDLAAKGYHPHVIGRQVRLMADLSIWLEGRGSSSDGLVAGVVEEYLRARRAAGRRELVSARAVAPGGGIPSRPGWSACGRRASSQDACGQAAGGVRWLPGT